MITRKIESTDTVANIVTDTNSQVFDMDTVGILSVNYITVDSTPAAQDFDQDSVDIVNNTIPIPGHGFFTGLIVQLTSTGTLPAPFTTATNYFVIVVDVDTIALADSYAHAIAGTRINITNTGTAAATGTATPTALDATISFQMSNVTDSAGFPSTDDNDWTDIDTPVDISTAQTDFFTDIGPEYRWFRIHYAITTGAASATTYSLFKSTGVY